jgi:hypothetical protein
MIRIILVALAAVFMASDAFADGILQYMGAGSAARALFPANDLLDWGQLGAVCQSGSLLCYPSPVTATSNRGIVITVTDTGGFTLDNEGTIGWSGGFQLGDHVLTDGSNSNPITFTLNKLVAGIGLEVYTNSGTFTETLQIFDDKGKLLSSITAPVIGGACLPPCNDAPFFGFYDPEGRIASLVISNANDLNVKIGWNQISLIDEPALTFAGTPGQGNCYGQSIATLIGLYGGLNSAVAALGFTSADALRNDIKEFCGE